jgi:5-methylcytosine-specific restriction endonuclease McrA
MKSYTKAFLKHWDIFEADFISCGVCYKRAVDIHHIYARSKRKDLLDDPSNLIPLCRNCHEKYGDKKHYIDFLLERLKEYKV